MYEQHIIIDFEMNPVARNNKNVREALPREIVEIGAVKLNSKNEIEDRFNYYVKPEYNTAITAFITRLTGISTSDVEGAVSLRTALRMLEEWIGYSHETRIYSWSDSDLLQIQTECTYKQIDIPNNLNHWIDFQKEYSCRMGLDVSYEQMALHAAAEQFGIIMDKNHSHSALYDAEITAELLIPVLTGEYRKQADIIRSIVKKETDRELCTIGDACGAVLQQLLYKMQTQPEFAR